MRGCVQPGGDGGAEGAARGVGVPSGGFASAGGGGTGGRESVWAAAEDAARDPAQAAVTTRRMKQRCSAV